MNWADTPEQARFREEVRTFIRERFPASYPPDPMAEQSLEPEDARGYNWPADRRSEDPARRQGAMDWARVLAERGWVAPHWPKEYGGAGLSVMEQHIFVEEMAKAGAPPAGGVGIQLLGPTLIQYGTDEQKREHLPKILSGEVAWAQGFSEPAAGSDLAALQARGVREGDHYVINGQKIWTSHAQFSDWIFALVRTDPEAAKHRGISFLLMDIKTPGITVQPILDMRGDAPFTEVFFDDVRVPVENLVGEENRGWYVAMATLDFERSGIGGTIKYRKLLDELVDFVRDEVCEGDSPTRTAGSAPARPGYVRPDWRTASRLEIADRLIDLEVLYNLGLRTVSMQVAGQVPNHEASVSKLVGSEVYQRLARTGLKAFGPWGNLWQREGAPLNADFTHDYVDAAAHTILSGTSEIMRNVIATRGLGLPRG